MYLISFQALERISLDSHCKENDECAILKKKMCCFKRFWEIAVMVLFNVSFREKSRKRSIEKKMGSKQAAARLEYSWLDK